jgi:DNA-binding MarR family transcriptional regulator/GNAT superfamily N-acetyltransferase
MSTTVEVLRSFHRSYAQRIGVLDDSFLGSGRVVGQARVLFEIGLGHTSVLGLRRRLGLDSGYLSRILSDLEADGVLSLVPAPGDARRRIAELTDAGRQEWATLDRRSDELAERLLRPLTPRQHLELAEALQTADRLFRAATVRFEVVDPRSAEALASMSAYFDELDRRFVDGFDPGDTLVADAPGMRAPTGGFVVAWSDEDPVASGGVVRVDDRTGEIKRMWVHSAWRGVGLGRRMLSELEQLVAARGYRRVVLDTNAVLTEAITMYERAGYRPIERYNDNPYAMRWFEKRLG